MYGTGLSGLSLGLGNILGFTNSDDESCDGDGGSLILPYENIGEAGTRKCTGNYNIFLLHKY